MSEEIETISISQKKTDLKSIIQNYKKLIITILAIFLLLLFSYFFYKDYENKKIIKISEKYNFAITSYNIKNSNFAISEMLEIINIKDKTYSPLALYFLLDNNLLNNSAEINKYFDILIYDLNLDKEIKNLIIYKKGLFNSEFANEEEILSIFKPLINNENLWRSHALFIIAEYFFSKNEKQKAREFFEKIIEIENSNPQIKLEAQKRLTRDFGV